MATLTVSRAAAIAASKTKRAAVAGGRREFSALFTIAEEFPDLPSTTPTPSKAGKTDITKLSNGLIVATEDGSSTSTVSLTFPKGGSSSEAYSEAGAAFANKCFAFKSAVDMSSISILRAMENGGACPFTSANRYSATVGYTCAPDNAEGLVGAVLSQTASKFENWDVQEAIKLAKSEIKVAASSPEVALTEAIYAASFGGETSAGRPFYNDSVSPAGLVSFRQRSYVFDGAVLTATGVDHESFVASVKETLEEVGSTAPSSQTSGPAFAGGEARFYASAGGVAHVALSLGAPSDHLALLSVLKKCLAVTGVSAFAAPGLVGVYASAAAAEASDITGCLAGALSKPFSDDVVKRAKTLAKAEALFALDSGSKSLAESMALNVLYTGSFSRASVAAAYDVISSKDVNDALAAAKKSGVSLAAVGEIQNVPSLKSISL